MQSGVAGPLDRSLEQQARLGEPPLLQDADRLARQPLCEHLAEREGFGQAQRPVEREQCVGMLPAERLHPPELRERRRQLGARACRLQGRQRRLEPALRLFEAPVEDVDVGEPALARAAALVSLSCSNSAIARSRRTRASPVRRGGADGAAGEAVACASCDPQSPQNRSPGWKGAPQVGHAARQAHQRWAASTRLSECWYPTR
jgi:hypothetical protein